MPSRGMRITLTIISLPFLLLCVAVLWLFVSTATFPELFYRSRIDAIQSIARQVYAELNEEDERDQEKIVNIGYKVLRRNSNIKYEAMGAVVRDGGNGAFIAVGIGFDFAIYYYITKRCYILSTQCFMCSRVIITTLPECEETPKLNTSSTKK